MSTRRKDPWHRRRLGRDRLPTSHPRYPDYPRVDTQTPDELWQRLVADGIARIPTPIAWLVAALTAVGHAKGKDVEALFVELDEEVAGMTGRHMTIEPGRL